MLNRQMMFDDALAHMREQGQISSSADTCLYRGPNGLKCAVGALIPDDLYDPKIEELHAGQAEVSCRIDPKYGNISYTTDTVFLVGLQSALHDDMLDIAPENFEQYLEQQAKMFATEEGLKYETPDTEVRGPDEHSHQETGPSPD